MKIVGNLNMKSMFMKHVLFTDFGDFFGQKIIRDVLIN